MKTSPNHNRISLSLLFVCAAALMSLMASSASAQGVQDIQWLTNVEQAKKIASKQNKLILLHFHAGWSRPCKALDTYVYRSAAVKKTIAENVVAVKLDADRALNLVNEYDVAMVPFDIVITPGGRIVSERRSPADADNYVKMIAGTSNASRLLEKEKMGPIAHQRQVVKNRSLEGQSPTEFRVNGPTVEQFGLSKDASLLQRRQTEFTENNSVTKTNPFVGQPANEPSNEFAAADSDPVSVQDLERDKFLSRERSWAAPSNETRRVKPERIVNDRYFESISEKQSPVQVASTQTTDKPSPFSLASTSREVTLTPADDSGFDLQLDSTVASHSTTAEPTSSQGTGNPINAVSPNIGLVDLAPKTPLLDRHKVSLKGKCPVTLITEGRWVNGDSAFGIVHRNRTYIFASAEKLAVFKSAPDKYSPMLAGFDPVIYHEKGKLVEGLIENGIFMGRMPEQKVVLFQDAETRSKFQASPKDYLATIRQATQNTQTKTTLTR